MHILFFACMDCIGKANRMPFIAYATSVSAKSQLHCDLIFSGGEAWEWWRCLFAGVDINVPIALQMRSAGF